MQGWLLVKIVSPAKDLLALNFYLVKILTRPVGHLYKEICSPEAKILSGVRLFQALVYVGITPVPKNCVIS